MPNKNALRTAAICVSLVTILSCATSSSDLPSPRSAVAEDETREPRLNCGERRLQVEIVWRGSSSDSTICSVVGRAFTILGDSASIETASGSTQQWDTSQVSHASFVDIVVHSFDGSVSNYWGVEFLFRNQSGGVEVDIYKRSGEIRIGRTHPAHLRDNG